MKRIAVFAVLFSIIITGVNGVTIKVGVYNNKPQLFVDDDGRVKGIAADLLNYIAEREGWELEYVQGSWAQCYERLKSGENDMQAVIGVTGERLNYFDYSSNRLLLAWGAVYVNDTGDVKTIFDLEGKRIANLKKGLIAGRFVKLLAEYGVQAEIVMTDSLIEALRLLDEKKVDAAVLNRVMGEYYEHEFNVERSPIIFGAFESKFAVRKGTNAFIIKAIDRHVEKLKKEKDSFYYRTLNKWLHPHPLSDVPDWAYFAAALIVVIALISSGTSLYWRKIIFDQTQSMSRQNSKLKKYSSELRRINIELKDVLRIVSHDVKSPLVSLSGFNGELKLHISALLSAAEAGDKEKYLEAKADITEDMFFIDSAVKKINRLISSVHKISKLERSGIEPVDIDMFKLFSKCAESMRYQILQSGTELHINPMPHVRADYKSIELVVSNLLDNALKYLKDGVPGRIETGYEEVKGEHIFSVRDNGVGIRSNDIDKIFKIFKRVGAHDKPGDGIGLNYVQTALRQNGGRVWCESSLGEGSVFYFSLPLNAYARSEEGGEG